MPQQTALQNLIDELKQFKKFPLVNQATIEAAIEFAELRLSMEKEQIIDSFNYSLHMKYGSESQINTGEQYYNETYQK